MRKHHGKKRPAIAHDKLPETSLYDWWYGNKTGILMPNRMNTMARHFSVLKKDVSYDTTKKNE